jgi:probable rRNA maturation factor
MSIARMQKQAESGEGVEGSADEPGPPRPSRDQARDRRGGASIDVVDPGAMVRAGEREWVRARLGEALAELDVASGEVRIRLTDDAGIAAAHAERCGVQGVTDVITFDFSEGGEEPRSGDRDHHGRDLDVDLLVCVDEARRQGQARGWGVDRELLLYALHGLLHCLGYDDADEDSSRRMHAREDELLIAIGVGRTYGDFGGGAGSRKD